MSFSRKSFGKIGYANLEEQSLLNDHGDVILKATPVRITSLGRLEKVNVSNESQMQAIAGVLKADLLAGESGSIIPSGILENITLGGATFGDLIYVSKTGDLTNVKPSIGVGGFVAGDFVIKVGVIAKNLVNPSNKDLLVSITIVGQL